MGLTDERQRALMRRAQQDDEQGRRAALAALLEDFARPATAVIRRTLAGAGLGDDDRVAEVLQTAALRFITRGLSVYGGKAAPRTYFLRIAINAAVDALRTSDRPGAAPRPGEQLEEACPAAEAPDPERALGDLEQQLAVGEALARCLEQLGVAYRESVELYYLRERGSCARCAELAGVSPTAFMQRISRARAQLADCISRRLEG